MHRAWVTGVLDNKRFLTYSASEMSRNLDPGRRRMRLEEAYFF